MTEKSRIYQTEGNRIPLYQEVGRYFYPDGSFDEISFRKSIRESIKIRQKKPGEFTGDLKEWLKLYLLEIIEYLEEKKLYNSSGILLRIAIDEAEKCGMKEITIPSELLNRILTASPGEPAKEDKMKDPDRKKEKIFNAALQVFSKKGFHKSTIDEIASLSGVGKGSVYRFFKSKEDLLEQLLSEKYQEIIIPFSSIMARDGDVLEQVKEMIELWIFFIEKNPVAYKLIQNESISNIISSKYSFYSFFIEQFPMLKERLLALNNDGKIKIADFYSVFYGILGFIDGVVHKWFKQEQSYPLSDEIPLIVDVLFHGFTGESSTGRTQG